MQHHRKYPSGRTLVPRSDVCAHQTAGVVGVLCFESGVASDDYYRGAQRRPHPLLIFRRHTRISFAWNTPSKFPCKSSSSYALVPMDFLTRAFRNFRANFALNARLKSLNAKFRRYTS
ncbi:uncharacterized protein LOC115633610 [Scaptodrosophila lebanonensis]|nr:uncharacterized protein LOC115633610 [Scaptodrosophila lebanonensis]